MTVSSAHQHPHYPSSHHPTYRALSAFSASENTTSHGLNELLRRVEFIMQQASMTAEVTFRTDGVEVLEASHSRFLKNTTTRVNHNILHTDASSAFDAEI